MKQQLGRFGLLALVAMPLLACGLSDWAGRIASGKPTPTPNIFVTVDVLTTLPSPTPEPAATPSPKPTTTPAVVATGPAEAVTPISQGIAPLPVTSLQNSLRSLDSLQAEYQFRVDSATGFVTGTVFIEETRNPPALHLIMASQSSLPGSENSPENLEVYAVSLGDAGATMYMQNPQDQSWLAIAINDINDAYDILPISLAALDTLPPQARLVGQENVNNVPSNHFTYTQNDFGDAAGLDEAQGDIWIAADQNIVMRLIQRISGGNTPVLKDTSNQITAYEMRFELKRFNDSAIIVAAPGQNFVPQP